jgi:hypothetical protein
MTIFAVISIDMSPSVASVDRMTGELLLDRIPIAIEGVLRLLLHPVELGQHNIVVCLTHVFTCTFISVLIFHSFPMQQIRPRIFVSLIFHHTLGRPYFETFSPTEIDEENIEVHLKWMRDACEHVEAVICGSMQTLKRPGYEF